jgi:hypothetical protein
MLRRLPIIRHLRYFYWRWYVEREYRYRWPRPATILYYEMDKLHVKRIWYGYE